MALPEPDNGEVRLRIHAIGLNRAEAMFRRGQYLIAPKFPSKIGYEASGIVEARTWRGSENARHEIKFCTLL